MGKGGKLADSEDQGEPDRDQRVDRPQRHGVDELLGNHGEDLRRAHERTPSVYASAV